MLYSFLRFVGSLLAATSSLLFAVGHTEAAPRVVVSIAPVHSLVASVMDGVGEPQLLLRGLGSPHAYQLRPTDARRLSSADIVFWVGGNLETFLVKPLKTLSRQAKIVTLLETPGLMRLPYRHGGVWQHIDHEHEIGKESGATDAHVWLDPQNAQRMVAHIATVLGQIDGANRDRYQGNAALLTQRLREWEQRSRTQLEPVVTAPYVVFHDAYQYLEQRFGLNALGTITLGAEQLPSAKRIKELRSKIMESRARCVFREPQFSSPFIETITEGTPAAIDVLDPLGSEFTPGAELYFRMMDANVNALVQCLGRREAM